MKIRIRDVMGIRDAEIDIANGEILEVAGPNASGKTSLATCAQAVLARELNPLGLSAAETKRSYVHDEADEGFVELDDGTRTVTWHPHFASMDAPPDAPVANPEAVGMIDFTAKVSAKVRSTMFQSLLLPPADTVMDETRKHLSQYLPDDDLAGVMKMLDERGWEPTEAVYADRAKESKRAWRNITNRNYGVRIAGDWVPEGWLADFDALTVQKAEADVIDARDALAALHQIQAITAAERDDAMAAEDELPGLRDEVSEKQAELADIDAKLAACGVDQGQTRINNAERRLADLRRERNADRVEQCPHCDGHVIVVDDCLVKYDDEAKRAAELRYEGQINDAQSELQKAVAEHSDRRNQHQLLSAQRQDMFEAVGTARAAVIATEHRAFKKGEIDSPERQAALSAAEQDVEDKKAIVAMVKAEHDASELNQTIVRYTEIAKAIGPSGIRAKMLEAGMKTMNATLKVVSEVADWPVIDVAETGAVSIAGRAAALCSESERWRAQAAIQLTAAAISKSGVVVLDRADILDAGGRDGLIRILHRFAGKTGIAVLLCSTDPAPFEGEAAWKRVAIKDGVLRC